MRAVRVLQTGLQFADLRQVELKQLDLLLEEESAEWREQLDWDFSPIAEQVRRFVAAQALPGVALLDGDELAGYGYTVLEAPKGLIGDAYLRRRWRDPEAELLLFQVLLDSLAGTEGIRRIESQLMLAVPQLARALAPDPCLRIYERRLLTGDPARPLTAPGAGEVAQNFRFSLWGPDGNEELPGLIVRAYAGQVDGAVNDQFTSRTGALGFLRALQENAGCGEFFRPASLFAFDRRTNRLVGAILTSFVARDTAHITQLCVAPEAQGEGLGRELLRRSLPSLAEGGARRVTLTVTAANEKAGRLYALAGFEEIRRFSAVVRDAGPHMSHS